LRTYELLAIVQPTLEEEPLAAVVDSILQVMTDNGGEIVNAEVLGKRRLAYAVKRYADGYYVLIHANLEPPAITALERALRLNEDVLRHLLLRLDEVMTPPVEEEQPEPEEVVVVEEPVEAEETAAPEETVAPEEPESAPVDEAPVVEQPEDDTQEEE